MKKEVESVLSLDKLVFEKIEFKRIGMKNEKNGSKFTSSCS